jgi:hypothetical protein
LKLAGISRGGRPIGLPDLVPYLFALSIPTLIRSTVSSRSISATAPKMVSVNLNLLFPLPVLKPSLDEEYVAL